METITISLQKFECMKDEIKQLRNYIEKSDEIELIQYFREGYSVYRKKELVDSISNLENNVKYWKDEYFKLYNEFEKYKNKNIINKIIYNLNKTK